MRIATFNIAWLGDETRGPRSGHHLHLLAQVIADVNADVYSFQEIVKLNVLRSVLDEAGALAGREWSTLANGVSMNSGRNAQKVVMAFDPAKWEVRGFARVKGLSRFPVAVRLGIPGGGPSRMVVGIHFKAGWPEFLHEKSAETRIRQAQILVDWLEGAASATNPEFPPPHPGEAVILAGDLNALAYSPHPTDDISVRSLDPLRTLVGWRWDEALEDARGGGRYTAWLPSERYLIDHFLLSPEWKDKVILPPTIHAFDLGMAGEEEAARVSDHRPVVMEVG